MTLYMEDNVLRFEEHNKKDGVSIVAKERLGSRNPNYADRENSKRGC